MSEPISDAPRRWLVLAVLCVALSAIVVDNTILSVALPSIAEALDADATDLQWVTTAYALVLSGLLLPLAIVGDRYGRRTLLLCGLVVFGGASAYAAFADTALELVLCRAVMGVGGAATMPATLSILGNVFSDDERGQALSIWSGVAGFAAAAGPLAGGLLLSRLWWGSVFLVNVPVVIVGILATVLWVPDSRDPHASRIDWAGAALWTGALVGVLFAIIEGPVRGWATGWVIGPLCATVLLVVAFVAQERRAVAALLPPAIARHPGMRGGAALVPAIFFWLFGMQFVLTQWLQGPRALGPLGAAACFVPNAVCAVAGSFSAPRVKARIGARRTIAAGLAVLLIGTGLVALGITTERAWLVLVAFGLAGLGQGLLIPTGMEMIMTSATPDRVGVAAGVNETIIEAGGALGVAAMGSVLVASASYARPLFVAVVVVSVGGLTAARIARPQAPTMPRGRKPWSH